MRREAAMVAAAMALIAAAPAEAQEGVSAPRAGGGARYFVDDLSTTVWSPHAGAGARVPGNVELDVAYEADVISSASVDVITAATPTMNETRHELGLQAAREGLLPDFDGRAGYVYSVENDTESHTGILGATHGWSNDNVQVGAQYALSWNRTGVAGEPRSDWGTYWAHAADLTLTLTLDERTEGEVGYSGYVIHGYQANPYRRVPVLQGDDLRFARWVEERVPDFRVRNAGVLRLRHAIGDHWVAQAEYRLYVDDWGVVGHTGTLEGSVELGEGIALHARERTAWEGGASFYQERYREELRYMTRDRRLSPHLSTMGGLALRVTFLDVPALGEIRVDLGADVVAWYFGSYGAPELDPTNGADLSTLGWVVGAVGSLGVEVRP